MRDSVHFRLHPLAVQWVWGRMSGLARGRQGLMGTATAMPTAMGTATAMDTGTPSEVHLGAMGETEDHPVYLHNEAMTIATAGVHPWTLDHPGECRLGGRIVMRAALHCLL